MKKTKRPDQVIFSIIIGIIILLSFINCQKTNLLEHNKAVIHNALEKIWNQGILDEADLLFADDYVYHGVPEIHGTKGIKQHVAALRVSVPDFNLSLEDVIAEGDKVVCRWTAGGTQKDDFMGVPPSDKQIKITGIIISRITEGKIIEDWEISDQLGLMQMMGVIPPMPDAPMSVLKREKPEDFLWSSPSIVKGDPGNPEKNKAIIYREEEEVWNQRNLETIESLYSPNFINHDTGFPDVRTREDFKQFWMMVGEVTQDYRLTIDDMIAEGDKVAVRWSSHFIEKSSTKPVTNKGIVIYRLADGKIVESWFSNDMLGFMRQLGVLPTLAA
jgi:steroid delta-isomerase-like uncharacterized protein